MSILADTSEFFRAKLEAFVATTKRERPTAWRQVEQLQRVCRNESPATAAGVHGAALTLGHAEEVGS